MFDAFLKNEAKILEKNNWMTSIEAEKYLNNDEIINAVNLSTSPKKENIFNALKLTSYQNTKVLILGQDPYPNPQDAHGLAFSSKNKVTPGSLKNIFIAIDKIYGSKLFEKRYNELTNWANQGVLLLNTSLTFEKKENKLLQQKSQNYNLKLWRPFIDSVITKLLNKKDGPVVMFLWGDKAQKLVENNIKKNSIVLAKNILILKSTHPSPLSVNRGGDFPILAVEHFKMCNEFLKENNAEQISWNEL